MKSVSHLWLDTLLSSQPTWSKQSSPVPRRQDIPHATHNVHGNLTFKSTELWLEAWGSQSGSHVIDELHRPLPVTHIYDFTQRSTSTTTSILLKLRSVLLMKRNKQYNTENLAHLALHTPRRTPRPCHVSAYPTFNWMFREEALICILWRNVSFKAMSRAQEERDLTLGCRTSLPRV